jgi:hypothetical protein
MDLRWRRSSAPNIKAGIAIPKFPLSLSAHNANAGGVVTLQFRHGGTNQNLEVQPRLLHRSICVGRLSVPESNRVERHSATSPPPKARGAYLCTDSRPAPRPLRANHAHTLRVGKRMFVPPCTPGPRAPNGEHFNTNAATRPIPFNHSPRSVLLHYSIDGNRWRSPLNDHRRAVALPFGGKIK